MDAKLVKAFGHPENIGAAMARLTLAAVKPTCRFVYTIQVLGSDPWCSIYGLIW